MRHLLLSLLVLASSVCRLVAGHADLVNPFIGTTNYGVCHPGAVCPQGLMSVTPFNVMGSSLNAHDKDAGWWSAPYVHENRYLTGFAHVAMSGVGCPEASALLTMATVGERKVDYHDYGTTYSHEEARPGYYACQLDNGVRAEVTASLRTSVERYTFPAGTSHILLNLGEGLTNESGATMRFVSDCEVEGTKLLGTFCYFPQSVFPIYFVMRVSKVPVASGYWKKMRPMTAEVEWDNTAGQYKQYTSYRRDISGDDIGAWFDFETAEGEQVEVRMGVSMVSIEGARANLYREQGFVVEAGSDMPSGATPLPFDTLCQRAHDAWDEALAVVDVEGGTRDQQTVFYTALYHTLLHPGIVQDVTGQFPQMESQDNGSYGPAQSRHGHNALPEGRNRYTVFSLWDTYRCLHQLMTLLYPDRQLDMVRTMVDMARENGWLPKWELYGRETMEMEGDPAIPVIVDTWMKGLTDFDIDVAYRAMLRSATTPGRDNPMRPDIDGYLAYGYCPMQYWDDNSVSHALEYYVADAALARWAEALGHKADAERFRRQSLGYRHYFRRDHGTLCPITDSLGTFYEPFDPRQGENFEPSPGFHEGNAWTYTFAVPHDIEGLTRLMGGRRRFVERLQSVFDLGYYDPTNEPDIAYPYLFSRFKGEEWRTQELVSQLLAKHFRNDPAGIPGNDDTGTMSAWAIFSMMGLYPDQPAAPHYTLTTPTFRRVTIHLDPRYYSQPELVIETEGEGPYIDRVVLGNKVARSLIVGHKALVDSGKLVFMLKSAKK